MRGLNIDIGYMLTGNMIKQNIKKMQNVIKNLLFCIIFVSIVTPILKRRWDDEKIMEKGNHF